MAQVTRSPKTYDVCVIGSGAGGGMAAKILTEGGLSVALLEAGPQVYPEKDFKMFMWPYDLPHRGAGVGGTALKNFSEFLAPNESWDIAGEPYTSAPGADFQWFRSRIVGGRTNHWGRIALRFAPVDFRSYTRDSLGADWPISYEDLAPYYDKVESYIGVFGTKENVSSAPDGVFLPPPAMATGKLTLITGAMAREIVVGKDGKAEGVSYIDKATRTEKRIGARAIVVAASACESSRLLLNSKSALFPDGLGNSTGNVGRYLTDSVGSDGWGEIPALEKMPPHNHDGVGGMHYYVPWWKFDRKNDFPRGYHIELWGGRDMPGVGMFQGLCHDEEGYGAQLKKRAREVYGTTVGMSGRGEMIPNADTYCELDPRKVDQWGIPVLRFHFKWTEYELRQAKDMQETFKSAIEMMGGTYKTKTRIDGQYPFGILAGGKIIHEVGTARMGADPKTSVLNGYCQTHDVKNVFVTDGAPLVTNPDKNPTLTIMALSWRASEYLLEESKKGNI